MSPRKRRPRPRSARRSRSPRPTRRQRRSPWPAEPLRPGTPRARRAGLEPSGGAGGGRRGCLLRCRDEAEIADHRHPRPVPGATTISPPDVPYAAAAAARGPVRWLHAALFDNVALKFLSLGARGDRVPARQHRSRQRHSPAKRRARVSELACRQGVGPDRWSEVQVTIRGSWRRVRAFDEHKIEPIATSILSRAPTGDIEITPDMIRTASGKAAGRAHVASVSPRRFGSRSTAAATSLSRSRRHLVRPPEARLRAVRRTSCAADGQGPRRRRPGRRAAPEFTRSRSRSMVRPDDASCSDLSPGVAEHRHWSAMAPPPVEVHVTISEELVTRTLPGLPIAVRATPCQRAAGAPPAPTATSRSGRSRRHRSTSR